MLWNPAGAFGKGLEMLKILACAAAFSLAAGLVCAQDMPGIENCSVEKDMARRTGCLQSNVNYLHGLIRKNSADAQQKLTAANGEITALKATVAKLQSAVNDLQAAAKKPPAGDKPEAAKAK